MNRKNIRTIKRQKARKRVRFFIFIFSLFLIAGSAVCLYANNYVFVKEIVFTGNRHLDRNKLMSLLMVRNGDRLFSISGSGLYDRLRKSPWIKDAVIRKELSGRLLISLTEAVPFAILSMANKPYLIDKDGVILEQIKEDAVFFLPVIKDINPYKNRDAYMEAVRFTDALNNRRIYPYSGNIVITGQRPEDLTLKADDIYIKIGAGDYDKKLERLEIVMKEIRKRNMAIEYIDMRFSNRIIVKPLGSESHEIGDLADGKEENQYQKR
jgi:cell division protein FtsQ